MPIVPGAPINGNGNGRNGRNFADPYGGIPKELRPDLTHLLMAAAIMHRQGKSDGNGNQPTRSTAVIAE
jgi:hypothetical protein